MSLTFSSVILSASELATPAPNYLPLVVRARKTQETHYQNIKNLLVTHYCFFLKLREGMLLNELSFLCFFLTHELDGHNRSVLFWGLYVKEKHKPTACPTGMVVVPWGSLLGGQRIPFLQRVFFKATLLKGPHLAERYFMQRCIHGCLALFC